MGVLLSNATLLARSVNTKREYQDLMVVEADPPTYGVYDATRGGGIWLETFDHQECVNRLRNWPVHHARPGVRLPYSARTELGTKWLAAHLAEQDRLRTEAEARQAVLTVEDLAAIRAGLLTAPKR